MDTMILKQLQAAAAYTRLYNEEPTRIISLGDVLGYDRRTWKRLFKEFDPLISADDPKSGYGKLNIDATLAKIQEEEPDLVAYWYDTHVASRQNRWDPKEDWEFIRVQKYAFMPVGIAMKAEHVAYVLTHRDEFRFYVVNSWPLEHNNRPYRPRDVRGPFTLEEAREDYRKVGNLPKDAGRISDAEIAISSDALVEYVKAFIFRHKVKENMPRLLSWGLQEFGVVTEAEAKYVTSGGEPNGFGLFASSEFNVISGGPDPDKWGDTLRSRFDGAVDSLAKLQAMMVLLRKIETGITAYGGWEKFRDDCEAKLVEALHKQKEGTNAEA